MMQRFSTTVFSLLGLTAVLPSVVAHGFLSGVTIDGKAYQGNVPNNFKAPSPIRLIDDIDPVKGANNTNLPCGQNAALAQVVADANPGSSVSFFWMGGDNEKWPHNIGPLMTYMAECTGTTCDKFDASQAKWFKIDEVGKEPGSDTWVQENVHEGLPFNVTLPTNIAPGDYLIRHEIIALHVAITLGGAEFYPSCTQVRIGGSGTGAPSQTVSFPGAYSDSEPGILDPDVFNPGSNYTSFPGPPLSNLVASGSNASTGSSSPSQATQNSTVTSTSAGSAPTVAAAAAADASTTSTASPGTCKRKRMVKRHKLSWF